LYRLRLINAIRKARLATVSAGAWRQRPNPLSEPLIVSVTSFGPRFTTLHLTLQSLIQQAIRPDAIVLWIADHELSALPRRVLSLESKGLQIRGCPDIRSYKKLIFALEQWPDAFIATADDDAFYEPRWLETMVTAVDGDRPPIICHRANRLALQEDGRLAPYLDWSMDVQDEAARAPSVDLVPTGIGGILYPPGSLNGQVGNRALFERLCPTADDLWFYWMARMAGSKHKKVGPRFEQILWPTFDRGSLASENWAGGNDRQIASLEQAFGNPLTL
jgi:hypothetical protein